MNTDNTKFIFIIPLVAKSRSKDWKHVNYLLGLTVRSIYGQTNQNFRIIVSCHDEPDLEKNLKDKIEYVKVDFTPGAPVENLEGNGQRDRNWKVCHGLVAARKYDPDYIMVMDADDWLQKDVVDNILSTQPENGYFFDKGYELDYSTGRAYTRDDMTHLCGSTFVLSKDFTYLPKDTSWPELEKCCWLKQNHKTMKSFAESRGKSLQEYPGFAITYVVKNGANIEAKKKTDLKNSIKDIIKYFILGKSFEQYYRDFGQHLQV